MGKRITPTGKRMFIYEGNEHASLISGSQYTMREFAEAINISPQTIQSRFKHRNVTRVVRDCDLFKVRGKVSRCKMIEYQGNHPDLHSGMKYSYVQLGKAFNISEKLIRDRMRGSRVFMDCLAITTPGVQNIVRCDTRSTMIMNEWLRRKIV
tara:strand:+ start:177 stop:632 length:456 start_codon:yes stop_codon:yes gene_type:complete